MLSLSHRVQRRNLLSSEAHGHYLHRLCTTPGPTTSATLQLFDVVASFGLVSPLLDLLIVNHGQIV